MRTCFYHLYRVYISLYQVRRIATNPSRDFLVLFMFAFGVILVLTSKIRLLGVGTMAYALLIPALGLTQVFILAGGLHWLIQALHLLVGIGAMYLTHGGEQRYKHLRLSGSETSASSAAALQAAR